MRASKEEKSQEYPELQAILLSGWEINSGSCRETSKCPADQYFDGYAVFDVHEKRKHESPMQEQMPIPNESEVLDDESRKSMSTHPGIDLKKSYSYSS